MSRMMKLNLVLGIAVIALMPLSGCASGSIGQAVDRTLFTPTEFRTNAVPERVMQVKTNQTVVVASTNAAGEVTLSTNREAVTVNITVPAHTEVEPIAWEPNKTTTAVIQASTAFVPGWGELIGWGLTGVLGIWASVKSRRYKAALVATCQAVEHVATAYGSSTNTTTATGSVATLLKNTLSEVHRDAGVQGTVNEVLNNDVAAVPVVRV